MAIIKLGMSILRLSLSFPYNFLSFIIIIYSTLANLRETTVVLQFLVCGESVAVSKKIFITVIVLRIPKLLLSTISAMS